MIIKFLCTLFLGFASIASLSAQNQTVTTGGSATSSDGTVTYSVGQVGYTNSSGTEGSVNQGNQQPFEISVLSSGTMADGSSLDCSVFPNPTTESVTINIEDAESSAPLLSFQLLDTNGKLLSTNPISSGNNSIDMSTLASGTYFIKVVENEKTIKHFKVLKN